MKTTTDTDTRKLRLPDEWRIILEISSDVRNAKPDLPQPYMWPIRGLARRAANVSRGLTILVAHGLWAEALILGRSLMEMEITLKWLLSEDREDRINRYIGAIRDEERRLARKMNEGVSVSAQILSEMIGDELRERLGKIAQQQPNSSDSSPRSWPPCSVREMAREVDLERNYDLGYWLESVFAHAHPLSVLEAHPNDWDHLLCPLFTCEARDGAPRALCLVALPVSVLHVFMTINDALHLGIEKKIEEAWQAVHSLIQDEHDGINWVPSEDVPPGEVHVYYKDGSTKRYAPKRRARRRPGR